MSQGLSCKCPESKKPLHERNWIVLQRYCNYSAFSGYRCTPSDYSAVQCHACGTVWRTKANYVSTLKNGINLYDMPKPPTIDELDNPDDPVNKAFPIKELSEGARKALQRPANYEELPQDEQWAIDKRLGILDWDGK